MMEFFSSHDGVKDHLGYLSFYPYCTFNTCSDDFQPCNALVPLTSHWSIASPLPCTLPPVSSPYHRLHLYARTSLHPSTQGRNAAHPNSPTVAPMKTNTTAWSLAESL
jgi:hypothetical protein